MYQLEIKVVDTDSGRIEGYGSVFGNTDSGGDIVAPGAFTNTIREAKTGQKAWPPMLLQHGGTSAVDQTPVGVWTSMEEDNNGLKMEGKLALDTERGRDVYALMKMKPRPALSGLSIGYKVKDWTTAPRGSKARRTLNAVDLVEVSLVTFPANVLATITSVKTSDGTQYNTPLPWTARQVEDRRTVIRGIAHHYNTPFEREGKWYAIRPGAFCTSLKVCETKLLLEHDRNAVIDSTSGNLKLYDDPDVGIAFSCRLDGSEQARNALSLVKCYEMNAVSIGIDVSRYGFQRVNHNGSTLNVITHARLFDLSLLKYGEDDLAFSVVADDDSRSLKELCATKQIAADGGYARLMRQMKTVNDALQTI
jgi:HK97 family phage prohead protease